MHAVPSLRRTVAWVAATTVSAAAGWAALQPVLTAAVPDPVDVVSAPELRSITSPGPSARDTFTPQAPVTPQSPTPEDTTTLEDDESPAPEDTVPPEDVDESDSGDRDEDDTDEDEAGGGEQNSDGSDSRPQIVDGWRVSENADGDKTYTQTFEVEGGTATVRIVNANARVASAVPNDPYEVDIDQSESSRVIVSFHTANRNFIIDAMWWDGRPYAQVSEVS